MSELLPASPSLHKLPAELLSRIAILAQHTWLDEKCARRAASLAKPRLLPLTIDQDDCCGVTAGTVAHCLRDEPLAPIGPAHALMDTCSRTHRVLGGDKAVWRIAGNALLRLVAELAGDVSPPPPPLMAAGAQFCYGTDVLIAENVCSCLTAGLEKFFSTIRVAVISLPWADTLDPGPGKHSVAHFFRRYHSPESSPLEHLDLELHEDVYTSLSFLTVVKSPVLHTYRGSNVDYLFYSSRLEVLNVTFPFLNEHCFGPSLLNALTLCTNLRFLNFDGGSCRMIESFMGNTFEDEAPGLVRLPALRYLRLLLPPETASELLSRLELPAEIDIHLEPVMLWRAAGSSLNPSPHATPVTGEHTMVDDCLWRYAAALVAPAQTRAAFLEPSDFFMPGAGHESDALVFPKEMAMNILLPSSISFLFASSGDELAEMLAESSPVSRLTQPAIGRPPRRSLSVRCPAPAAAEGNLTGSHGLSPLCLSAIRQMASILIHGQINQPYSGLPSIRSLTLSDLSRLPESAEDWEPVLSAFAHISRLVIRTATPTHICSLAQHLAMCLQGVYPLPAVETVAFTLQAPSDETPAALLPQLSTRANTPARLASGARPIQWTSQTRMS
ncbi:unnamed protein product [Peniophora sp. CBMAI 1063]|nr:unnamed protein product [Peniophora sp. CBMAI 1063]